MYTEFILMLISTILPVSIANAADTPTNNSLKTLLDFCKSNPDGNITNDLVNTSEIRHFYPGYTCEDAAQEKAWLDGNQSNTTR